jgi:peptide/nickel transport system ATP-binding protein
MQKLEVQNLSVRFGSGHSALTAVDRANLAVPAGGTMGLVGESGSGKSTVGRAIVQLVAASGGRIMLDGEDVTRLKGKHRKGLRKRVQMVFQDPYSSLNPRMAIGETIDEAILTHRPMSGAERTVETARILNMVSLEPWMASRYPHQFSGGQRQRIAIARALAVEPEVVILDEVTSSVDVSVQANMLNLLRDLQRKLALSYLLISHNLSVVRYVSDEVSVMYLGTIVERAPTEELFAHPCHPYTRALIDSIPGTLLGREESHVRLTGEIPDPHHPPTGCRFRTRCPVGPLFFPSRGICVETDPRRSAESSGHYVACHFPL